MSILNFLIYLTLCIKDNSIGLRYYVMVIMGLDNMGLYGDFKVSVPN